MFGTDSLINNNNEDECGDDAAAAFSWFSCGLFYSGEVALL